MTMKNKLYISLLAACVAGFSSCERDIDNFMVDDTIGLMKAGVVEAEVYTGFDDPTRVYAIKAGKGFQGVDVSIAVDDEVLATYNATADVQLSALPAECYAITVNHLGFGKDDYKKAFEITWDRDLLAQALANDANAVIPLRMSVNSGGINIAEDRLTCLVKPVINEPKLYLSNSGLVPGLMPTRRSAVEEIIYMNVNSSFIAQQDVDFSFEIDADALAEYNESHDTDYQLLPEDAYELNLTGWCIKKYMNTARFNFKFIRTALIPEDGPSKFGMYMLPIRLKSDVALDPDKSLILYPISIDPQEIAKSKWTVLECSPSIEDDPAATDADKSKYAPSNLIDGDKSSFWRTAFSSEQTLPYSVIIDLGQDRDLFKLEAFPPSSRSDRPYSNSKAGYVEVSADNQTWTKVGDWSILSNSATITCQLQPCTARYVKFVITDVLKDVNTVNGVNCHNATAISEITLWGE